MSYYETLPGYPFAREILEEDHVLIGGATGSGKSVILSDILYTLTSYHPEDKVMFLIDLKKVELSQWEDFPHCIKFVDEEELVVPTLECIIKIMMRRYQFMKENRQKKYNGTAIYVIIDELAQVLLVKGALPLLVKLGQLARASNIHLICCTQNVSRTKGIPASLQQNFGCCIGLRCKSAIESKQIIGVAGCENLPRFGQAIIDNCEGLTRLSVPFLPDEKIEERLNYYKAV